MRDTGHILYSNVFTDATRPETGVTRLSTLAYTHAIALPEDVEASFEVASPLARVIAFLLDALFLVVGLVAAIWLTMFLAGVLQMIGVAIGIVLISAVYFGYFMFFEGIWGGQTPGKRIMGLRTITPEGREITPAAGLVRAFTRLPTLIAVPLLISGEPLALLGCLDGLFMVLNKQSRRLGDLAAGTIVVVERRVQVTGGLAQVPRYMDLEAHYFPVNSKELQKLSPQDFATMEELGARIRSLRQPTRSRAAMVAAGALATKMNYSRTVAPSDSERFLFEVHCALKEQMRLLYPDLYG